MLPRICALHAITLILAGGLWPWCTADIFSAMTKVESLLDTRQRIIDDLEAYILKEDNRLHDLKLYLNLYKREQERAMQDVSNYVGNPINAYTLIKRLTADLDDIERRINQTTEYVSVRNGAKTSNNETYLVPTAVDMEGAGVALRRLQKTYKLNVEDIADGVLKGVIFTLPMTASDCNELGDIIYKIKDYKNSLAWQMEALRKLPLEDDIPHTLTEIDIMDYISILHYRLEDLETASEWTMRILEIDPDNQRAIKNLVGFEQKIMELEQGPAPEEEPTKETEQIEDQSAENKTDVNVKTESKSDHDKVTQNKTETTSIDKTSGEIQEDKNEIETDENIKIKKISNENESANGDSNVIESTIKNEIDSSDENDTKTKIETITQIIGQNQTETGKCEAEIIENKIDTKNENSTKVEARAEIAITNVNDVNVEVKNDAFANNTSALNKTGPVETAEEKARRIEDAIIDFRKDMIMHESLCRGEYELAPEISSRLSCRYLNDKPFLKLAPIKMEQHYIDPDAYVFYDVISDKEIEHVKDIARPRFRRARVGASSNVSEVANYRISQSAWLLDSVSDTIARLTQRIADFTGLSMKYAEELQVANYGIGGQYEPHYDYAPNHPIQAVRIATVMFYLSDVAQGGATVFPKLGLSVFPVKGSAIFWYNLQRSAEGNRNTRHAACPVLEGSKWVANKWIRLPGQELIWPCNLEHQIESVIPKLVAPPVLKAEAQEFFIEELNQY